MIRPRGYVPLCDSIFPSCQCIFPGEFMAQKWLGACSFLQEHRLASYDILINMPCVSAVDFPQGFNLFLFLFSLDANIHFIWQWPSISQLDSTSCAFPAGLERKVMEKHLKKTQLEIVLLMWRWSLFAFNQDKYLAELHLGVGNEIGQTDTWEKTSTQVCTLRTFPYSFLISHYWFSIKCQMNVGMNKPGVWLQCMCDGDGVFHERALTLYHVIGGSASVSPSCATHCCWKSNRKKRTLPDKHNWC